MSARARWRGVTLTGLALLALALFLILAPQAHCADWRTPALVGVAGASLDEVTTRVALARGATEGNPLVRNGGVRLGVRVAEAALVVGIDLALQRIDARLGWQGRLPWVWRGLVLARGAVAAWINLRNARRG
jgi:hypothetical protein